jgi:endonuclease/exonuclease/phosphatase (EEP) superfamily protein YafD
MKFVPAFKYPTVTHKQGGHLDQVFVRNLQLKNAMIIEGYYDRISDHKCLKVTVKLKERTPPI